MKRLHLIAASVGLVALAATAYAQDTEAFSEDPLIDSPGHFIYNTFMQLDGVSGNNLHYGIDIAGAENQTVKPGIPSGQQCRIIGEGADFRVLYALRRQGGKHACHRVQHIYPNPAFAVGDRLSYDDIVGTLDARNHLHSEINLSPDSSIENRDLRNPERYAFENASWIADSKVPVVDSLVIHSGSPDTLQIWVHDTTDENPDYYNGIYKLLLTVSGNPVDSVVLDQYLTQGGAYPPDVSEIFYDSSTPPSGYNDPNVLNYKLIGEVSSATWRVAWWDAHGNHEESDPVEPSRAPSGQMEGSVQNEKIRLSWRVDSVRNLRQFDVLESLRATGGFEQINREPILTVAGQLDYEFLADLPEEWDQIWYRVTAKDVYGADHLLAQRGFTSPYPRVWGIRTYPNPSGSEFRLELQVARRDDGRVEVYSPAGRRVRTIYQGELSRGTLDYTWDGRDEAGRRVSPGVYFLRVETRGAEGSPARRFVRKLVVLR